MNFASSGRQSQILIQIPGWQQQAMLMGHETEPALKHTGMQASQLLSATARDTVLVFGDHVAGGDEPAERLTGQSTRLECSRHTEHNLGDGSRERWRSRPANKRLREGRLKYFMFKQKLNNC